MNNHKKAGVFFTKRQRLILFLLLGSQFMFSIDFSILNIALPQIGAGVGMAHEHLPWLITAFMLPAAGLTLLFGRIADLYGRRRMFLVGVTLLAVSSLLGGVAIDSTLLIVARTLQGVATAVAGPAALSLLTTSFTNEKQRAKVLGLNGALLSAGFAVGALAGGLLISTLGWRWAFLINVPITVAILAITPFIIRSSREPSDVRLDILGAVTVTSGLLGFVYGIIDHNIYSLISGLVLLVLFWFVELHAKAPLASVYILGRPSVKWGSLGGLMAFGLMTGLLFLLTLYLQEVLHLSALQTGLIFGVPGVASIFAGILAGRFINRYGARKVLVAGLAVQGFMILPIVFLDASLGSLCVLLPTLFIAFFGHVTAIVAYAVAVTSDSPDSEQGLATGVVMLVQQVAVTIGIPVMSAVAALQTGLLSQLHFAAIIEVVAIFVGTLLVRRGLRVRMSSKA